MIFKDNQEGKFVDCRHGQGFYGGAWLENIAQALERDIIAEAIKRLEAAGYPVVLTVHDEIIAEVPNDFGNLDEFHRLLTIIPEWAPGLPIAVKVRNGARFSKPDKTSSKPAPKSKSKSKPKPEPSLDPIEELIGSSRPITAADLNNINAGLQSWGIEPISSAVIPEPKFAAVLATLNVDAVVWPAPNGQGNGYDHSGDGNGDSGSIQGQSTATWIYAHPDKPFYLRVAKHIAVNGERHFYQYHWDGSHWVYRVKSTYAEQKIPYRLPELLATPATELIFICEGEKDADNVAALGLIATTNPGGAKVFQPELAQWFAGKQRACILEDNDDAGREHTRKILAVLSGIVPAIGVVPFPELAEKGDISDWLAQGGNKPLLLARATEALRRGVSANETPVIPVNLWGHFDPPVLPRGLLPAVIERFALEEAELMGADASGLAVAALAVCAAALPDHTSLQSQASRPTLARRGEVVGWIDWQSQHQKDADYSAYRQAD